MSKFVAKLSKINHRKNFLDGASQVLTLAPQREYNIPKRGDFARDAYALHEDFKRVGKNLNGTLRKHASSTLREHASGTLREHASGTLRKHASGTLREHASSTLKKHAKK